MIRIQGIWKAADALVIDISLGFQVPQRLRLPGKLQEAYLWVKIQGHVEPRHLQRSIRHRGRSLRLK